jgi:hypothetical protein
MKLLARFGGGKGRGMKAVDKIGLPVSPGPAAFFLFLALGIFSGIFGGEKKGGELSCWTPYSNEGQFLEVLCG